MQADYQHQKQCKQDELRRVRPGAARRMRFLFLFPYNPQIPRVTGGDAGVQRRLHRDFAAFFAISRFRSGTPGAASGGYLLENVLRVHPAGRELRSTSSQHAQDSFTALVDESDFVQVHDASACYISAVVLLPARFELMYPGFGKPAVKNPSFFRWCFTEIDLQHAIFP
jgi:hypothetical protein